MREHKPDGDEAIDRHRYRIRVRGKYPQFLYWLAMPFFAPMPWEADKFHSQPGMARRREAAPLGAGVAGNASYVLCIKR